MDYFEQLVACKRENVQTAKAFLRSVIFAFANSISKKKCLRDQNRIQSQIVVHPYTFFEKKKYLKFKKKVGVFFISLHLAEFSELVPQPSC